MKRKKKSFLRFFQHLAFFLYRSPVLFFIVFFFLSIFWCTNRQVFLYTLLLSSAVDEVITIILVYLCVIMSLETGSFTVLNTKLEDFLVAKYVTYIYSSKFIHNFQCSQMFIQVQQISMITVQINIYSS